MIVRVIVPDHCAIAGIGHGLRPVGDSIPRRTWRAGEGKARHDYPTEGCHGEPLEEACPHPMCINGNDADCGFACSACNGTGRVQLDHPNRTDMP